MNEPSGYALFRKMTAPVDVTHLMVETSRLILRPMKDADLPELHRILSNPEIAKFDGWQVSESLEETQRRLKQAMESREELAVVLKETGKLIGTFALQARDWAEYPIDRSFRGREFGFDLNQNDWGRGLMPEAVAAMTEYCFQTLGYDFVTCGYFVGNERSARLIEKCGFAFLYEGQHTMPTGERPVIRTYIRYNPRKEIYHV